MHYSALYLFFKRFISSCVNLLYVGTFCICNVCMSRTQQNPVVSYISCKSKSHRLPLYNLIPYLTSFTPFIFWISSMILFNNDLTYDSYLFWYNSLISSNFWSEPSAISASAKEKRIRKFNFNFRIYWKC
jgi:hypothetical protein